MKLSRDAIGSFVTACRLRACDVVGPRVKLVGKPFIANDGEIVIADDVTIRSVPVPTHIATGPRGRVHVGRGASLAHGVSICSHAEIRIGERTVIGPFAVLLDVDFHEIADRGAHGDARPIVIGDDVRIGAGAVILRGAVIGDGAVIAPRSVVARRIPPGARVAGVPARPDREGVPGARPQRRELPRDLGGGRERRAP